MNRRVLMLSMAVAVGGSAARAAPTEVAAAATAPVDAGSGFHLEGKPEVDDVFGDASDYRRTIDRFIELATQMQSMRDEFARSVQSALNELGARGGGTVEKKPTVKKGRCPVDTVAAPYAKAHHLGAEYLRVGRELTRHYDQVKEFDRLGESIGLTPDYRWKVKRVLQQYTTLLTDYREMKVAFHDQLVDELKYAGCDLQALLIKGDPQALKRRATTPGRSRDSRGRRACSWRRTIRADARRCRRTCRRSSVPPPGPIPLPKRHGAGRSDGERDALGRALLRRQHQVRARRDRVRRRQEARRGAGGDARRLPGGAGAARSLSARRDEEGVRRAGHGAALVPARGLDHLAALRVSVGDGGRLRRDGATTRAKKSSLWRFL